MLDPSQSTQLLNWLDEEHRKDKTLLVSLQSQIDVQKSQLTEQARQLQDIHASLTRVEAQLTRLPQLEGSLQGVRAEFSDLLARHAAEQEVRLEQRTRTDKVEGETMARMIRQLQERLDGLGTFDSAVELLRDEDSKLQAELTKALSQVSEVSKRLNAQVPRIDLVSQEAQALREGMANLRSGHDGLSDKANSCKAALDTLGPRLDARLEQMQASLDEAGRKRQTDLELFQVKLQDQARQLEELGKELKTVEVPITRWAKQMEEFAAHFERNRKTLYHLHELEEQMRQQGSEVLELQRLAAERQRAELREWQDNQVKVDEEQTTRVQRLETLQAKLPQNLENLEQRLEQNKKDIEACRDELWRAWTDYMQGQIKLLESTIKRRRAG